MKTRLTLVVAAVALALLASGGSGKANLALNGDFNNLDNTYVNGGYGYMLVNPGSTAIPGWAVSAQTIAWMPSGAYLSTFNGPSGGGYFLDLTGIVNITPFGAVVGTAIPTVAGNTYTLSFYLGRGDGEDANPVVVQATAGAQTGTFTVNGADPAVGYINWQRCVLQFTATGSSTSIDINANTSANNGNGFIGLANVSVVPEPTTMIAGALLLLPFGASTLRVLRRRTA
jgi:hypothetical protein